MNFRLYMLLLMAVSLPAILISCASTADGPGADQPAVEETGLSRPLPGKPVRRPLGQVRISWEAVENAASYKVEKSSDRRFDTIDHSWTVSGTSLEIPVMPGEVFWIRVQAVNRDTRSRWSPEIEIREARL